MIAIADYDAGNIKSVEKALLYLGEKPVVTSDREVILSADKVIVPGVGAFGDAMKRLEDCKLADTIKEAAAMKKPLLGICLGLQLFFDESEEAPGVRGLGLIPGKILRFPDKEGYKIPHMGWNSIKVNPSSRLFEGIDDGTYFYFVHSYYLHAENEADVSASSEYTCEFHAAVERENIFATQFHPEKSGDAGLNVLKNFVKL